MATAISYSATFEGKNPENGDVIHVGRSIITGKVEYTMNGGKTTPVPDGILQLYPHSISLIGMELLHQHQLQCTPINAEEETLP